MTSALEVPPIGDLRISGNRENLRDARIAKDAENQDITGTSIIAQFETILHCLPITPSSSLPETAIKGKRRIRPLLTSYPTTDSSQCTDDSFSLVSSAASGDRDHPAPKLPTPGSAESEEPKPVSLPGNSNTTTKLPARDTNGLDVLPHPAKCGCGCVPKIPSLFEMAELRRQHRLRLQNAGKSQMS